MRDLKFRHPGWRFKTFKYVALCVVNNIKVSKELATPIFRVGQKSHLRWIICCCLMMMMMMMVIMMWWWWWLLVVAGAAVAAEQQQLLRDFWRYAVWCCQDAHLAHKMSPREFLQARRWENETCGRGWGLFRSKSCVGSPALYDIEDPTHGP